MKIPLLFLGPDLSELPRLLRSALTDEWIGSFQVGFGPPLVRSSERLIERLAGTGAALDKLDAYLACCILDEGERQRLAAEHRRLVVRRLGPVEAETLDRTAGDALDLRIRLKGAESPPPDIIPEDWKDLPRLDGSEEEARFLIRLDDPSGARWLSADEVSEVSGQNECDLVVELRVDARSRELWTAWAESWSRRSGYPALTGFELRPHARVIRNGERY
jgi:hypothetical protein